MGQPWVNTANKPIVDASGVPIWCEKCPCPEPFFGCYCGWGLYGNWEFGPGGFGLVNFGVRFTFTISGFDITRWGILCSPPYNGPGWTFTWDPTSFCDFCNGTFIIEATEGRCQGTVAIGKSGQAGMFCGTSAVQRFTVEAGWNGTPLGGHFGGGDGRVYLQLRWYSNIQDGGFNTPDSGAWSFRSVNQAPILVDDTRCWDTNIYSSVTGSMELIGDVITDPHCSVPTVTYQYQYIDTRP